MSDLEKYLDLLFGDDEGYVYAPYKDEDEWIKVFFKWPDQKEDLITDIGWDVGDQYIAPALFGSKSTKDFRSSRVVWVDFDEGTPHELGDFPKPTIRVRSSNSNKEHWYWKLDRAIGSSDEIERFNRQLAYALNGDRGCWNYGRVLRPPTTRNYKYNPPAPVSLVELSDSVIDTYVFKVLPEPS